MDRIHKIIGLFKKNRAKIKHYARQTGQGILLAGLILIVAALIGLVYLFFATPKAELEDRPIAETTQIFDRSGEHVLYELHGEYNRKLIGHDDISDVVRMAVIATEDAGFYDHFGIDPTSIVRAFKVNLERDAMAQGASTITQQLARSAFLTREKSLMRKVNEIILAFKIEWRYEKSEILDFYLNEVPFGSNAYGIQSAAEIYFSKDAKDLTLDEAAMLAAIIKAPTYYSPYGNHRQELLSRQRWVLGRMVESNLISASEKEVAFNQDILAKVRPFQQNIEAPHFVFYVKEWLEDKYGNDFLETGGLKVATTLDYEMQKEAERIVRAGALANEKKYRASNAALTAIDPKTGEILAMVGSRDYFDASIDGQVNVATSLRQPGSSFKPIVYARAFELGYQPETLLFDVPTDFGPDGSGKNYIPRNYNGQFSGLVSLREALARSLNIPAVKTLHLVGVPQAVGSAKRLGINTLTRTGQYGLSLVLGGGEVKLTELAGAFSVFANDGVRNELRAVIRIDGPSGETYGQKDYAPPQNALDVQAARKINSVLSDNVARSAVFGAGSPLHIKGHTVAAKTGTTQDNRDGWTVGYSPNIAVGVWAGNNDSSYMRAGADGVYVAAPIWNSFMRWALERYPNDGFAGYDKVSSTKPMITGNLELKTTYYTKGGTKISEKKAKNSNPSKVVIKQEPTQANDIIYYINKDDPLGILLPDLGDPMVERWNRGVREYLDQKDDKDND